ncbi:MAG: DUF3021 domain-containing protein [Clostridia bacterium]|nr:DUF3021 domain-containing protein [Clostridia bacterium]
MNRYVKSFLHRGLMFGGFGPIVAGVVYWILSHSLEDFSLGGGEVFLAILSTYLLAFVQAGASVFPQMEEWPLAKSLFCHFGLLYLAYIGCYLLNAWIPFEWSVVFIFSAIFAVLYFVIWFSVYLSVKETKKFLNERLKQ